MISIKNIRENPLLVQDLLAKKGYEGSIVEINSIDKKYRLVTKNLEESRAKKNVVSQQVAESKRNGFNADNKIAEMRKLGEIIKSLEEELNSIKNHLKVKLDEIVR